VRFDGQRLKALRTARKWDQHRLAETARRHGVGITQSQVSRYENGQEPSGRNALALAAALEVDVADFYAEKASSDDDEELASMALTRDEYAMLGSLMARLALAAQPELAKANGR
jgi:transcriptional regulator with XRE-family HTH domain